MPIKAALVTGVLVAALTGCASQPQPLMSHTDPAVQVLNDAAQRVARASEQSSLAQSVQAGSRVTQEYRIDMDPLPTELRDPLLLEGGFHGELEVFLRSIADVMGWPQPEVLGTRPPTPLLITMTEQRRPPVYWIADAGYQVGDAADVVLNVSLQQIIILYDEPAKRGY